MKDKKQTTTTNTTPATPNNLFGRENYIWMIGGLIIITIGILLMVGGKSDDPNIFKREEVYSTRRITIAPILILLGLAVEAFAIFKKPKNS